MRITYFNDMGNHKKYDLVCVGKGIASLSTAFIACQVGLEICVIGADHTGSAAWASGGMLAPKAECLEGKLFDLGHEALKFHQEFLSAVESLSKTKIYRTQGFWVPVYENDTREDYFRSVLRLRPNDCQFHDSLPWETTMPYKYALFFRDEQAIDPRMLIKSLLGFLENTVDIIDEDVVSIQDKGRELVLESGKTILTKTTMLAAGHKSNTIRGIDTSYYPVQAERGIMLRLENVLIPDFVTYSVTESDCVYIIPDLHGIRLGSTASVNDLRTQVDSSEADKLIQNAIRLYPKLNDATLKEAIAGFRPKGPVLLPYCDQIPSMQYVWTIQGLHRNGILMGPFLAQQIVHKIKASL